MTRFGMEPQGFEQLAQLIRDVVVEDKQVKEAVSRLRQQYMEIKYCFKGDAFEAQLNKMMEVLM